MMEYVAHDGQSIREHLLGVSNLASRNAKKINCSDYGQLLGLLHDLGKYSSAFQKYIKSAIGSIDPDIDEESINIKSQKGTIDHSTAGAQFLWRELSSGNSSELVLAQLLAICLVSHHSGLINCLTTDNHGTYDNFSRRITKVDQKTHLSEAISHCEVLDEINKIISKKDFVRPLEFLLKNIFNSLPEKNQLSTIFNIHMNFLVRFLFSCLIDADRQDTADSDRTHIAPERQNGIYLPWKILIERLEEKIAAFGDPVPDTPEYKVNCIRTDVGRYCLRASLRAQGLFTLTVPTGGGKTLASLRFALHHAEKYGLDRIVYVIPFTSIIDQNAAVVRAALETADDERGRIVLEHHSNIGAEKQSWKEKLLCENWDAPVVYTTMVQFLETMFGGGTRGARRMHQLARSVIVFDEIQTLPIRCVHLFCNAINFLTNSCGSSVVLCTATQPLLGEVDALKGNLTYTSKDEIVPDVKGLFIALKRVEVEDKRKPGGWSDEESAELVIREMKNSGSCLIVVNMKKSARNLFIAITKRTEIKCFHLSTGMCPAHRKAVLNNIRGRLDSNKPTICVSTQLIEAGVDVDFTSVVRFIAGLDSIAQAAGRCNRNGKRHEGRVFIINPAEENIDCLKDIKIGQEKTERVLNDYNENPTKYGNDRIGPKLLNWYYQNYFYGRKKDMDYPIKGTDTDQYDNILNMLATNSLVVGDYKRANKQAPGIFFRQSFMTAGEFFKAIDAPTRSVIVRFGDKGKEIVNALCASFDVEKQFVLLREAQQYSVNLFPHEFIKLSEQGAINLVQEETEIFYLSSKYYSEEFGLSMTPVNREEFLHV